MHTSAEEQFPNNRRYDELLWKQLFANLKAKELMMELEALGSKLHTATKNKLIN